MADLAKQVGARIKMIRKSAKVTQEELAERIGITREYVSRIEVGLQQPMLSTLTDLAHALNVSATDFFDFKGPIVFSEGKLRAKQRKECLESIYAMLKEMDLRELRIAEDIIRALTGKKH